MHNRGKRILLLLPEVFAGAGGIQMFGRALCMAAGRWAQQNDAQVSAIVLNDSFKNNQQPDSRYVNDRFRSYLGSGRSKTRFVGAYVKQLLVYKPDVIIFGHLALSPLSLITPSAGGRVKSCVIAYGIEAWRRLTTAEGRALRNAEAVLAISEYTREQLLKRNALSPAKVKLFPCTLDPYWTPDWMTMSRLISPASPRPVLLTVSRLTKDDAYKGVDSVIESLPAVIREIGAVDYRIVGSGDDVPRLRALAKARGVADYVTFTGALTDEELRDSYRQCSAFVLPSEGEGFGIVFLEAMAYGKPVIGGAHAGTPSVVTQGETGLLVERSDIAGLSRAIVSVLQDTSLQQAMGRAGQQRLLDNFVFARFEENLDALLSSFLSNQKSPRAMRPTDGEMKIAD